MKTTDGTGAPLVDDALYYVQDARSAVGNCGSWWAPKGAGYVCSIDEAGLYTGAAVRSMRSSDVPWPEQYVLDRVVRHVRVDNQAFQRRDDDQQVVRRSRGSESRHDWTCRECKRFVSPGTVLCRDCTLGVRW